MTIGSLIVIISGIIIFIVCLIFAFINIFGSYKQYGIATLQIIGGIVALTVFVGGSIFYLNTETGKRAIKDLQSEMNSGIERTVQVYDVSGELIKEYSGKFDVETGNINGNTYIVFDDENGKRHIVYYTTGTILIDEK